MNGSLNRFSLLKSRKYLGNLKVSSLTFNYCFLTEQVETPKIAYSGQKLIILVKVNTPANTSKIIPNVPSTMFVK